MYLGKDTVNEVLTFCDEEASTLERVLEIEIDRNLTFEDHSKKYTIKRLKAVSALQRIVNYSKGNFLL